jgi:hypothetical protein
MRCRPLAPKATNAFDDALRPTMKEEAPANAAQATDSAHQRIAADVSWCRCSGITARILSARTAVTDE